MKKHSYLLGISLLILSGCGTLEESTEAIPAEAEEVKASQEETFETASKEAGVNGNTNTETDMSKKKAEEVLKNYRETFMGVISAGPELEEYESRDEIIQQFSAAMTEEHAATLTDIYIKEENGELAVIATEAPIWLKENQEYDLEKVSEKKYNVVQDIHNELIGDVQVTFTLSLVEDRWLVSDTGKDEIKETEDRDQEPVEEIQEDGEKNFK